MCMRVGAKNVQNISKTVMPKTASILPRLSGLTFENMLLEERSATRSHLNEELHST